MYPSSYSPPCPRRFVDVSPYSLPSDDARIDLRLDANEGPCPSVELADVLAAVDPHALRRYPSARVLEQRLAERYGVDPARCVVTNGGDDAIQRVCLSTTEPGRNAVLHAPTFEMIPRGVRLAGGALRTCTWLDGPFPTPMLLDAIDERTSLVTLVSPNNPTGQVIPIDSINRVCDTAARCGAVVLIDLAYVEFAESDPTICLLDRPNVIVARTFSKAHGLAGIRLGYAMSSTALAERLRAAGNPYPVSAITVAIGLASLDASLGVATTIIRRERGALSRALVKFGAVPIRSEANFVTARFDNAAGVQESLRCDGIAVRAFPGTPGLEHCLRITLPGSPDLFSRLLRALRSACVSSDRISTEGPFQ